MSQTVLGAEPRCSIARTLQVLGEKWTLLIVRSAFQGDSRYSEFRERLDIPTDVLATRLGTLVDAGILERRGYRESGSRERNSYHLTPAGSELKKILVALGEWGTDHLPTGVGATPLYIDGTGNRVRLEFVAASGARITSDEVAIVPGPGSSTTW